MGAPPVPLFAKPMTKKASSGAAASVLKNPSKIILLLNMVGPGEVDDMLEQEVAGECAKYGPVAKCIIFQVTKGQVPDTEAVRIFVRFERQASAIKGLVGLNNRFFGGRKISASFFDEDRFARLDLAPRR